MGKPKDTQEKKEKIRGYCPRCRHQQIFVRSKMHHGVHLFFSFLTLGLWAVSWLAIYIGQLFRPWRCEHCRWHKPEFPEGPAKSLGQRAVPGPHIS